MPQNKNQHFVPQVYLRQFAADSDKKRINLALLNKERAPIIGASIRDQCSLDYFYGNNALLEDALQAAERLYGKAVRQVAEGDRSAARLQILVWCAILQHLRTERALRERMRLIARMDNEVLKGQLAAQYGEPDKKDEIQAHVQMFASTARSFDDLSRVILENKTPIPFITSDDPSIVMNRLNSQRYKDPHTGLINSGVILCLPLTPNHCLLAYDEAVYSTIGTNGTSVLRSISDVDRINSLQVQRGLHAVYFNDPKHSQYVERAIEQNRHRRRDEWNRLWIGTKFEEGKDVVGYRTATEEEKSLDTDFLAAFSPIVPEPSSWPSFFHIKMRPKGYTNGSAVGFVREAHVDFRAGRFVEVVLPRAIPDGHTKSRRDVMYHRKDGDRPYPWAVS